MILSNEITGIIEVPFHGESAYEIAVKYGYEGTEAEWVENLGNIPPGSLGMEKFSEEVITAINAKAEKEELNNYLNITETKLEQGNILNIDSLTVGKNNSAGILEESQTEFVTTDYERVVPGGIYSGWTYSDTYMTLADTACFDKGKNYVGNATKTDKNILTMPEDAYYARISFYTVYTDSARKARIVPGAEVCAYTSYKNEEVEVVTEYVKKEEYDEKISELEVLLAEKETENALDGKKIMCIGDSIMYGSGNNGICIGELIAEGATATVYNYSQGGATMGYRNTNATGSVDYTSGSRQNILYQTELAMAEGVEPDYILINGGTNDITTANLEMIGMGEITTGYNSELDIYTFTGAMETVFKNLKTAYPSACIIYIRVHNMGSRGYTDQITYGHRALEVCEKWSIPAIDLYKNSGLNTNLDSMLKYTYVTESAPEGDKTHPNKEGYKKFYIPLISDAIKKYSVN